MITTNVEAVRQGDIFHILNNKFVAMENARESANDRNIIVLKFGNEEYDRDDAYFTHSYPRGTAISIRRETVPAQITIEEPEEVENILRRVGLDLMRQGNVWRSERQQLDRLREQIRHSRHKAERERAQQASNTTTIQFAGRLDLAESVTASIEVDEVSVSELKKGDIFLVWDGLAEVMLATKYYDLQGRESYRIDYKKISGHSKGSTGYRSGAKNKVTYTRVRVVTPVERMTANSIIADHIGAGKISSVNYSYDRDVSLSAVNARNLRAGDVVMLERGFGFVRVADAVYGNDITGPRIALYIQPTNGNIEIVERNADKIYHRVDRKQ